MKGRKIFYPEYLPGDGPQSFKIAGQTILCMGDGGGGTTTTTSYNQYYSPEEAARRAAVMDEAQRIYNLTRPMLESSAYPGARPVPFSSETLAGQRELYNRALSVAPTVDMVNQGLQFGLTKAADVNSNPYLQKAIDAAVRPITRAFSGPGGVLSEIRTNATTNGQFGGSRQGIAEGIAAANYMQQVADTSAKMANEGYMRGLDTLEKSLMLAPSAFEAQSVPAQWLSSIGAQKENLGQELANYEADQRMWGLNAPWLGLQNYANIVFGAGSSGGTSTSIGQYPGQQRNPLLGALGGASMGISLAGQLGMPALLGAAIGAIAGLL